MGGCDFLGCCAACAMMSSRWQLGALAFVLLGALVLALEDDVRADLVAFYSRYNVERLYQVDHLIAKYAGKYEAMWPQLRQKYLQRQPKFVRSLHHVMHPPHAGLEQVALHPHMYRAANFAQPAEVQALIQLADSSPEMQKSQCDGRECRSSTGTRSSTSLYLHAGNEQLVDELVARMHRLIDSPLRSGEDTVLVRYRPGEKYEFHFDTDRKQPRRFCAMLLYLSSHKADGSTIFPMVRGPNKQNTSLVAPIDLKLRTKAAMAPYCDTDQFFKIHPVAGDLILFFMTDEDGMIDEAAWHGACPVRSGGTKYLMQHWITLDN